MKHISSFKLFEYYQDTYWSKNINGKEVTVTIHQVQDYLNKINAPVIEIPVKDIESMCIHVNKNDKETKERSEKSDLGYPIIIVKSNNIYTMILDGHHRLLKAINHNLEKIKAKVLDLGTAPLEFREIFKR